MTSASALAHTPRLPDAACAAERLQEERFHLVAELRAQIGRTETKQQSI